MINRSLLNWGVFLIALGGVPLAVKQGWAEASIAGDLWRVWPLILVGIGLGLILRWTPMAWLGGAIVAGTFGIIFGALIAGGVQGVSNACIGLGSGESQTTSESGPASGTTFDLQLELSCGDVVVTRGTADEWSVEATHDPEDGPVIEGSDDGPAAAPGCRHGRALRLHPAATQRLAGRPAGQPVPERRPDPERSLRHVRPRQRSVQPARRHVECGGCHPRSEQRHDTAAGGPFAHLQCLVRRPLPCPPAR